MESNTELNFTPRIDLQPVHEMINNIKDAAQKVIIGQHDTIELLLTALLADGHVLIEGIPGVAKTLMAKTLARLINVAFNRIQFTPDLMPSDVTGTNIFSPQEGRFVFRQGPVFGNIILIDEVNRAPAKTQAALFEVMEERQVTVDGTTYPMQSPFIVIATQNPVEHEGTYRLPEAQLDRFLFKINIDYPNAEEESLILLQHHEQRTKSPLDNISPIVSPQQLSLCRELISGVKVDARLIDFIACISIASRQHPAIYLGASPRASIALLKAAKATAVLRNRDFVTPEDILHCVAPVLRHRIALTPDKEIEGVTPDDVIRELVSKIDIPR